MLSGPKTYELKTFSKSNSIPFGIPNIFFCAYSVPEINFLKFKTVNFFQFFFRGLPYNMIGLLYVRYGEISIAQAQAHSSYRTFVYINKVKKMMFMKWRISGQ